MRAVLIGVAAAVMVATAGGVADGRQPEKIDAKLLVGKWQVKAADVKLTTTTEYTKDGKMLSVTKIGDNPELKVDGTYKLDGNKLSIKFAFAGVTGEDVRTVHLLSKTELVIGDAEGKKDTWIRVAAKSAQKD